MLIEEALKIIKNNFPEMEIIECLEFPEFYAFAIIGKGAEHRDFGGGYNTVSKRDGSLSTFTPTADIQLFMSAKSVDFTNII